MTQYFLKPKILLSRKNFRQEKLGPKQFVKKIEIKKLGPKKLRVQKFQSTKFWVQKIFGQKKKIWSKKLR